MQHPGTWTKACISRPHLFVTHYPVAAKVAREFIRQRPDLRGMKFDHAHVDNYNVVTIHLESPNGIVDVRVKPVKAPCGVVLAVGISHVYVS